jgi:hypothetical protein
MVQWAPGVYILENTYPPQEGWRRGISDNVIVEKNVKRGKKKRGKL